jgi:hypothetical protein
MVDNYEVGVLFAILSGAMNAFSAILQKSVVNKIPIEDRDNRFMTRLLRSPAWWVGFGMSMGLGTIFNLRAQSLIGPALVPGLTASGMIILAIGSVRLIGEKLRPAEVLGIVLMVAGISFLGYSNLSISSKTVDLFSGGLLTRLIFFSVALGLSWLFTFLIALQAQHQTRGLTLAVSGGFPYCISNLWILPLILTIGPVFSGTAQLLEVVIFILACILLVITNLVGIRQVQEAYKFAPASKAQPIQQIPTQIVPILIYLIVFQRSFSDVARILVPLGVSLVIVSGFLLGQRRTDL